MFSLITKLFKNAQNENEGQALSKINHSAKASKKEADLIWQPLDVSRLNITGDHLRSIEASIAEKSRAEFAAVTKALNASQKVNGSKET